MNLIQPMDKFRFLLTFCCLLSVSSLFGQATLPDFTLKSTDGKISVFWLNNYKRPVKGISVQRSYDSTKNFFSIASILNPQNSINGFTDSMAPYNKMYYRLFIGFDTGVYLLTRSKRCVRTFHYRYSNILLCRALCGHLQRALRPRRYLPHRLHILQFLHRNEVPHNLCSHTN